MIVLAENCQGGQLSFFLQVVKTALLIIDSSLLLEIELPFNLAAFFSLEEGPLKLIDISFPISRCLFKSR